MFCEKVLPVYERVWKPLNGNIVASYIMNETTLDLENFWPENIII